MFGKNQLLVFHLLFFAFISFHDPVSAQNFGASSFDNVVYYTTNDGLSQNEVTSILKDKRGFLWVGTRGGLNRFDGTNFKVFIPDIADRNSLPSASIESLYEDSTGFIWIGTKSDGLSRYDPIENEFKHFNHLIINQGGKKTNRIISITQSSKGDIWAGSWENGISVINPENDGLKHLLPGKRISALLAMEDGSIFAGTSSGLFLFDHSGRQIAHYLPSGSPSEGEINFNSITYDSQLVKLFLASWSSYLYAFDIKEKKFESIPVFESQNIKVSNNTYQVYPNGDGKVWLGSWRHGLKSYDSGIDKVTFYDVGSPSQGGVQLYKDIISIYKDDEGLLWLGTNGGGLCKIVEGVNQFNSNESLNLPSEPVWGILNDTSNGIWVGFRGVSGLYHSYDRENYTTVKVENEAQDSNEGFRTIYEDLNKKIWTATNTDLYQVVKGQKNYRAVPIVVKDADGKPAELVKVSAYFQTKDSVFWIGTQQSGLFRTVSAGDPVSQPVKSYPQYILNGLQSERITCFLEDQNDDLWIGTYGGLLKYNKALDNFIVYIKEPGVANSLSSNIVFSTYEDSKGRLWIGTPSGLNLKQTDQNGKVSFKVYDTKDGLPDPYIHSILEDNKGNIWVSTNKGLAKFNVETGIFSPFTVNDGLKSNSFMENTAVKDQSGNLYFGGIYGLNSFNPDSIRSKKLPKVVFTDLKVQGQSIKAKQVYDDEVILNKAIEYAENVNLTYDQNTFTLFFSTIDFRNNTHFTFRYKLEGADQEWHTGVNQNNITYANLSPGSYQLKLKVIGEEDQLDPAKEAVLNILIKPPFWATWQAYILYFFLSLGMLWLGYYIISQRNKLKTGLEIARIERANQLELAELKINFFTNITHELRTPLSLILGPVERLVSKDLDTDERRCHLVTVHYHTKRLLRLVQQLLDFRKSEEGKIQLRVAEGNFVKFAEEIFISFKERAKAKNIAFTFESSAPEHILTYDRNQMEIVLCNLLINAFNYGKAGEFVHVSIKEVGKFRNKDVQSYCQIKIKDSGQGMSSSQLDMIFDRFYQVANTNSAQIMGSGIGLYLVKQIVEMHHGKVNVKSKEGKGSVFTILLPKGQTHFRPDQFIPGFLKSEDRSHYDVSLYTDELPFLSPSSKVQRVDEKQHRLLVVEDNPEIRSFIVTVLSENFEVIEAEDGVGGLEKAKNQLPDLIISDLMMPYCDGIELCKKLRDCEETVHIPIIILTARTAVVHEEEGYSSGADVYVTKPFHPSVLIAQVNALITKYERLKNYFGKVITLNFNGSDAISEEEQFINEVIAVIEANLENDDLNREFLASQLAMSPSTFYRKIKTGTNLGVNGFVRAIRLKKAAQMLGNREGNVSDVAYAVGFQDLKYFRECFKKQFGKNPSDCLKG